MVDQNITIITDNPNYFYINNYTTPMLENETYRVTWGNGGTQYICETQEDQMSATYDGWFIGNPAIVGGEDTGEPFLIYRRTSSQLVGVTNASAGTIHLNMDVQRTSSGGNYQAKTNINPTTSSQTITPDSGYDALSSVQINAMPSGTAGTPTATKGTVSNHSVSVTPSVTNTTGYITGSTKTGTAVTVTASELASGNKEITANGTNIDVVGYSTVSVAVPSGGGGKNVQVEHGTKRINATAYTDVGYEITVAKTGTYNVYWAGWRSSSSGTSGTQLYVNDTASGNAITTFDSTWTNVQNGSRTGVSLTANDKVTLRARSRGTNYYMYVFFLSIEEV